jgi:hypothetical protein
MRKLLYIFILTLLSVCGYGQVYQSMPQYGYGPVKRFWIDSTLSIPTVCGVPTLKSYATKQAAIAFDSCNNRFYFYNPKTLAWDTIKGGGASIDTTSLSGRIELRLKISDTASMLLPYLRKVDTASMSLRIASKVDSIKRSADSVYYYKNGQKYLAFRDSVGSGFVPYTGATQDVDLGNFSLNAKNIKINGTAGNGHIDLKHQSSDASAQGNTTSIFANSSGYLKWKNDNLHYSTLAMPQTADRVYTFQNKSYTLGDSADISARVKYSDTAAMLTNYAKKNYFNLQNVTDNGNITNNNIFSNSINVYDEGNEGYVKMDGNLEGFRFFDINSNEIFDITEDQIALVKPASGTIAAINSGYITGNRYFYLPDITGTFAMRGDSTLFQTKYRTDTARINIYSSINGKVKYSDTAAMLTNYFKSANYDNVYIKGMQAAGSTIKGTNMAVPYYNLISQTTALTNAQMRVVLIYLPNAATLTGIKFYTAGGTNNAGTFNGVGLYKVRSGNDSADLVASCANDTSLFEPATANSWVTKAFTSTYSASAGLYYAAIICSYNTGTPSVGTSAALANTGVVSNMDISPNKISAVVNSQTSFGSKFGLTQFTSVGTLPAIYIY